MKILKKFLFVICASLTLAACKEKSPTVVVAEDLMAFGIEKTQGSLEVEYETAITLTAKEMAYDYQICVTRNGYVGKSFPDQTASVIVVPTTTAIEDIDFKINNGNIRFTSENQLIQRFSITIMPLSQTKIIDLKLDYTYEEASPRNGRKADKLKITVNPVQ